MEKTISEEYVQQLSQLHDEKASFGDAKGLKAIEKWIKEFKPQSSTLQKMLSLLLLQVLLKSFYQTDVMHI